MTPTILGGISPGFLNQVPTLLGLGFKARGFCSLGQTKGLGFEVKGLCSLLTLPVADNQNFVGVPIMVSRV